MVAVIACCGSLRVLLLRGDLIRALTYNASLKLIGICEFLLPFLK